MEWVSLLIVVGISRLQKSGYHQSNPYTNYKLLWYLFFYECMYPFYKSIVDLRFPFIYINKTVVKAVIKESHKMQLY